MKVNLEFCLNSLAFLLLLAIFPMMNSDKSLQCGRTVMTKIIHGQPVTRGTYPWMVVIVYAYNTTKVHCGAALITRRYVVTAKHCVNGKNPADYKILLGTNNIKLRDRQTKLYTAKQFIPSDGANDDIALIELPRPVKLGRYIQPICLPSDDKDYSDVQAVVAGFGETNPGVDDTGKSIYSNVLLAGVVNTTSTENCNRVMSRHHYTIGDETLCAGSYHDQPDHCYGDSGGPLMYFDNTLSYWLLIGAVSAAFGCDIRTDFSYYSNVSYYKNWIISNSDYGK